MQMSRMPRAATGPELKLRKALHAAGLRFRVQHRGLPGTPDVALTKARIAIFVDGCFWHGCPQHATLPKHNRSWWGEKFEANRLRDVLKDNQLRAMDWLPVHVWEHEELDQVVTLVRTLWRERTGPDHERNPRRQTVTAPESGSPA